MYVNVEYIQLNSDFQPLDGALAVLLCSVGPSRRRRSSDVSGGWTNMAAVMRLVNRSTLSSAMGQQYVALSSAAKVNALNFLVLLPVSQVYIMHV